MSEGKRIKYRIVLKLLVEAIREKPRSKSELLGLIKARYRGCSLEAVRKACERCLKQLEEELKVIEQRGDKYCWMYYPHLIKGENLESKIKHSKMLIPALFRVAGFSPPSYGLGSELPRLSWEEEKLYIQAVEQHLLCYKDIWSLLSEYRKLSAEANELEKSFKERLLRKLRAEFGNEVKEFKSNLNRFVSQNLPSIIYGYIYNKLVCERDSEGNIKNIQYRGSLSEVISLFNPPTSPPPKPGELWWRGILVAMGEDLHQRVKDFIIRETLDKSNIEATMEVYKLRLLLWLKSESLKEKILTLKHRIECGEPLRGRCIMCPQLEIASKPP